MDYGAPAGDRGPGMREPYELADGVPTNGPDAGAAHRVHVREQNARRQHREAQVRRR